MSSGYQRAWLDVKMFQYFIINRVFKSNLEESSLHYIIHHGGSELCKGLLPFKELLFSMNNRVSVFSQRREILDYSYAGHWTSRKHFRLYLSLPFCQKMHPRYVSCTCMHPVTSLPHKQCYRVVGHTLMHTLSKFEVNQTDSS